MFLLLTKKLTKWQKQRTKRLFTYGQGQEIKRVIFFSLRCLNPKNFEFTSEVLWVISHKWNSEFSFKYLTWGYSPQPTFFQRAGMRASYMQSRASRRFSLMMMVPSIASLRSVKVFRTRTMTLCIRSISWRRKMFMGWKGPIFWRRSLTWLHFVESRSYNFYESSEEFMIHGVKIQHTHRHGEPECRMWGFYSYYHL